MPHFKFNSDINGTGGLQRFLDNYEGWLDKLQEDYTRIITGSVLTFVSRFFE